MNGRVAQLAEHSALNRQVVGSIPTASTNKINNLHHSLPEASSNFVKLRSDLLRPALVLADS